jgi:hypothetical protein
LPSVWHEVDWRSLRWIVAGCAVATPIGIWALVSAPTDIMRLGISAAVVGASLLLLAAPTLQRTPGPLAIFIVGCAVGLLNGAAGVGGSPAVLFYFATVAATVGRASLIAFFIFTDSYGLLLAGTGGLLNPGTLSLAVFALPFMLGGIWLGNRRFIHTDPQAFRRMVLWLLVALGCAGFLLAAQRLMSGA